MRKAFTLILVVCGIQSCTNADAAPLILNGILTGKFIEITPENNRTTLIFSSNDNQLQEKRISDNEDPILRTFSIRLIDDNMIELSSNEADEIFPRIFHYQIVDDDTFEIGNINPNDDENTIMTFKRV